MIYDLEGYKLRGTVTVSSVSPTGKSGGHAVKVYSRKDHKPGYGLYIVEDIHPDTTHHRKFSDWGEVLDAIEGSMKFGTAMAMLPLLD